MKIPDENTIINSDFTIDATTPHANYSLSLANETHFIKNFILKGGE
jgi:hypothetical protein